MPEISIIIRTFNEEKHLGNLLRSIEEQGYRNYEVIVIDSGSTDNTLEIARKFNTRIIQIDSRDFTFGYALNVGCRAAKGKYFAFVSAHVLPVDTEWLGNLLAPFADTKVAMVYGRQLGDEGAKFSEKRDLRRLFGTDAFDSRTVLDYANNANSAVRAELWQEHQFDEYLFGLEDIEWARWAISKDCLVHYAPQAAVYHIHREAWHQVFNRYRREAIAAVRIGLKHPPQSRIEPWWMFLNLLGDTLYSFPNWSPRRLNEIARFRYYQWKGGRQGWLHDRHLDFDRDKFTLFRPEENTAIVIHGPRRASLEKRALPELKPGDILVQVSHVGICQTDVEVYEGTLGYYREGVARYPIVSGHEYSGTIVNIGANNKYRERFKVGDRVVGECVLCREEDNRKEIGVVNKDGACAEFVSVPGDHLHKVPEDLDLQTAALTEPLAVVLRSLRRLDGRLQTGVRIGVIGAGPIGNFCTQVLAKKGYDVTVFDRRESRLVSLEKVATTSAALVNLARFDVLIEATGSKEVLSNVLGESRLDSTILLLGFPYGALTYNFEDIVGKEKVIIGSVGADRQDFEQALKMLPSLDTKPFTRSVFPLDAFRKAWDMHRSGEVLKVTLSPHENN